MSKKKRVPASGPVWRKSAEEATLDAMPKFNAHQCGTGAHGDAKYNRAKAKRNWMKEEARNCGPLPLYGGCAASMLMDAGASCLLAA